MISSNTSNRDLLQLKKMSTNSLTSDEQDNQYPKLLNAYMHQVRCAGYFICWIYAKMNKQKNILLQHISEDQLLLQSEELCFHSEYRHKHQQYATVSLLCTQRRHLTRYYIFQTKTISK